MPPRGRRKRRRPRVPGARRTARRRRSRHVARARGADVEQLYAAADVVALPALYEPFGNVHLEALASGVPVLTSAQAGGSEVIVSGRNGWVVAAQAGDAIAEGLRALRDDDVARLAKAARESAEPFTYAAQADAFEGLYRALSR